MTEVQIHPVFAGIHPIGGFGILVLQEVEAEEPRRLSMIIGPAEAQAIGMGAQGVSPQRPLTWDLMLASWKVAGMTLERIQITALVEDTYHGLLTIRQKGEVQTLDCRPSDGIALAVRAQCNIYAAEEVLEAAERSREEAEQEVFSRMAAPSEVM